MKLSAELFEWMIGTIESGDAGPAENRRAARVSMRGKLETFLLRGDDVQGPFDVGVRDASASGMRLEFEQSVSKDTQVLIRLPRLDAQPLMLLGEIVHCRKQGDRHSVGVKFRRILDAAEFPGQKHAQCVF